MLTMFNPTPQQTALKNAIENGNESLMLIARAGTGKTASIIWCIPSLEGTVEILAYNKAAGDELQERAVSAGVADPEIKIGTVHASALRVWRKRAPKVLIDDKKTQNMLDQIIEAAKENDQYAKAAECAKYYGTFLKKLVSLAKQRALGVESEVTIDQLRAVMEHYGLEDEVTRHSKRAIRPASSLGYGQTEATDPKLIDMLLRVAYRLYMKSLDMCPEVIDFDDMILAPLAYRVPAPKRDWVVVDEAQDTNEARMLWALNLMRENGRMLIVGDPKQAIYGFTGANSDSMHRIAARLEAQGKTVKEMPLTITHRCPKAVVSHVRTLVPDFAAADDAPEGSVRMMKQTDMMKETLGVGDAILCRNMAPLVSLAYEMIGKRMPFVFDAREFGVGLKKLVKQLTKGDESMSVAQFENDLKEYASEYMAELLVKGKEEKAERFEAQVETLLVFTATFAGSTVATLLTEMDAMFDNQKRKTGVLLTTVHRSKGREWKRVYLLGRNAYMPSKWAKKEWQMEQEFNLIYVACTRAKEVLVEVTVEPQPSRIPQVRPAVPAPTLTNWVDAIAGIVGEDDEDDDSIDGDPAVAPVHPLFQ